MEILVYMAILLAGFVVLIKSAEYLVTSSIKLAKTIHVPEVIIGIVLVSLGTTAPELAVSVNAAYKGESEIALGNAIGSVICDDGIALALAAILASSAILISKRVWKFAAIFLSFIYICTYLFALNGTIGRMEGGILLIFLFGYFSFLFLQGMEKRKAKSALPTIPTIPSGSNNSGLRNGNQVYKLLIVSVISIIAIGTASHFVVYSTEKLAIIMKIPTVIISLTVIAIGTSLPEITTCVVAAKKGYGDIVIGNIIGADILNILWIIGASSLINPIRLTSKQLHFMFPSMMIIVGTMIICMRVGYKIGKTTGFILLTEYVIYIVMALLLFSKLSGLFY